MAVAAIAAGGEPGGLFQEGSPGRVFHSDDTPERSNDAVYASTTAGADGMWRHQKRTRHVYNHTYMQAIVVSMIMGNFIIQCCQAQFDPSRERYVEIWEYFEHFFNIAFAIELGFNMYGHWFWPFFQSYWNIFDVIVVSIGLLDTSQVDLPGPLRLVRMVRAFRAFRLFGKVESLRKIIVSLRKALPGVSNAFIIIIIIMAIFAVLGVNFFRTVYTEDCVMKESPERITEDVVFLAPFFTARALCYGEDYYGTFAAASFTLFQVLTGESWSEAIARPTLHYYDKKDDAMSVGGSAAFYILFILVNQVVLMNIIIALLIDGIASASEPAATDEAVAEEDKTTAENKDDAVDIDSPSLSPSMSPSIHVDPSLSPEEQIEGLKADVASTKQEVQELFTSLTNQVDVIVKAVRRQQELAR